MAHIPESENNPEGDDDKIYLFFTEAAVEYDSYSKVDISRVARVCKVKLSYLDLGKFEEKCLRSYWRL